MRPVVYMAGPISGLTLGECTDWRIKAKAELANAQINAVSPLRGKDFLAEFGKLSGTAAEYGHVSPLASPRGIMTRDRFDATRCDVLLVNLLGAERVSIGTCLEIAWADLQRIPVVCAIEPHVGTMPDAINLAWLAALIDGEGSVYLVQKDRASGPVFEFRIQVTMCDKCMVDAAYERSGRRGIVTGPYKRAQANHRESWRWNVSSKQAQFLAAALYPYLVLKKVQAAAGYQIEKANSSFRPEGHKGHKGFMRRPPEVIESQKAIYAIWRAAQDRVPLPGEVEAPPPAGNVHEHAMLSEAIGFRVATLDEAIAVVKCILG